MNSFLYRVTQSKCPNCGEGDMFPYSAYNIKKMGKMNKECPNCRQTFEPEPVFYTGAMYVSYAFSVAIIITVFLANNILGSPLNTNEVMLTITGVVIAFAPLSYRWSRSIWGNLFIPKKGKSQA